MKVVDAVAEILRREGTEYLFCFPTTPLIEACAVAGIRPIVTRVERTLVNMADGYTRVHRGLRNGGGVGGRPRVPHHARAGEGTREPRRRGRSRR